MTAPPPSPAPQSPPPPDAPRPFLWTPRQLPAVWFLAATLLVIAFLRYRSNPLFLPDPLPPQLPRADQILHKIDPNTADWPTLAALPVVGKNLAQRIVQTRDDFVAQNPGQLAFARPEDLRRVKGIGPATLAAIEPHLLFPTPPATRETP